MWMCIYIDIYAPNLRVWVYIRTYMHAEFTWGCAYIYMCGHRVQMVVCIIYTMFTPATYVGVNIFAYMYTEFACVGV